MTEKRKAEEISKSSKFERMKDNPLVKEVIEQLNVDDDTVPVSQQEVPESVTDEEILRLEKVVRDHQRKLHVAKLSKWMDFVASYEAGTLVSPPDEKQSALEYLLLLFVRNGLPKSTISKLENIDGYRLELILDHDFSSKGKYDISDIDERIWSDPSIPQAIKDKIYIELIKNNVGTFEWDY